MLIIIKATQNLHMQIDASEINHRTIEGFEIQKFKCDRNDTRVHLTGFFYYFSLSFFKFIDLHVVRVG